MTLDIRPTPPDHPQVQALIAELDAYLRRSTRRKRTTSLDLAGLMASVGDLPRPPGRATRWSAAARCARCRPSPRPTAGPTARSSACSCRPRGAAQRIGQRILAALETALHAQGIDRALLETGEELASARRACTARRLRRARRVRRLSGQRRRRSSWRSDGRRTEPRRHRLRAVRPARTLRDRPRALDAKWKQLQGAAHPDRFATETAAAQRVAMQWAIRINEAYRRLKDPLARAAYLCTLHGADVEAESNTAMPAAFLMQQMEWRDALSEATTLDAVDALSDEVVASRKATLQSLQAQIDDAADGRLARRRRHRARPDVRRQVHERHRPPRRRALIKKRIRHGIAPDLRTRPGARSAPAPHRRGHRPRHHAFAGRRGAPRRRRVPARRRGPRDPAVGRALPRRRRPPDRPRRARVAGRRRREHGRLGQALHGPHAGRRRRPRAPAVPTSSTSPAWWACTRATA